MLEISLAAEGFVWKENNQQQEDKHEASGKMVGTWQFNLI